MNIGPGRRVRISFETHPPLARAPAASYKAKEPPEPSMSFDHRHLLGIEPLRPDEIVTILDLAENYVALNRRPRNIRTCWPG